MRYSLAVAAAIAVPLICAAPVEKRALSANDAATLELALYLENLEHALYSGGYSAFSEAQYEADGFPPGFRDNVGVIASVRSSRGDCVQVTDSSSNSSTRLPISPLSVLCSKQMVSHRCPTAPTISPITAQRLSSLWPI